MKCPYCGKEMTLGYIQSRDGVYWTEKKRFIAALPLDGGKKLAVGREQSCGDTNGYVEAWNCWTCKKILIDYEGESQTETDAEQK